MAFTVVGKRISVVCTKCKAPPRELPYYNGTEDLYIWYCSDCGCCNRVPASQANE